jgi:hypothetical protein
LITLLIMCHFCLISAFPLANGALHIFQNTLSA